MIDHQLLDRLEQIFQKLSAPLTLLDIDGNSIIPANDLRYTLPTLPAPGTPVYYEGRLFQVCQVNPDWVLMAAGTETAPLRDAFLMCDAMMNALADASKAGSGINNVYQRILQNELSPVELDAVADEHHLQMTQTRCVLIMHMVQVQQQNAYEILDEMIPRGTRDVLVPVDKHTAALIKDVMGMDGMDELVQFAGAVQETVLSETALKVTFGIGNIVESLGDLHESFRQAHRAIEIGRSYSPERAIHVYARMLLERFLSDLSPETAEHYHQLLFNRSTTRLFTDEMLYTIEMFFDKDLNLSDTARQLYIHRNTLVYRLDKVQKQTGLDLRHFEDAVTFKMLLEMRKCCANKAKAKKNSHPHSI